MNNEETNPKMTTSYDPSTDPELTPIKICEINSTCLKNCDSIPHMRRTERKLRIKASKQRPKTKNHNINLSKLLSFSKLLSRCRTIKKSKHSTIAQHLQKRDDQRKNLQLTCSRLKRSGTTCESKAALRMSWGLSESLSEKKKRAVNN